MTSVHLLQGFFHLFCFVFVLNGRIPFVLICFVPADRKVNAICFGLVVNEKRCLVFICFIPPNPKLNVICFVLVLNKKIS